MENPQDIINDILNGMGWATDIYVEMVMPAHFSKAQTHQVKSELIKHKALFREDEGHESERPSDYFLITSL